MTESFWPGLVLSEQPDESVEDFYEAFLPDEQSDEDRAFAWNERSRLWEARNLQVGRLTKDGSFVDVGTPPMAGETPIADSSIDLTLEGFFAAAMPGSDFSLQLSFAAAHQFAGAARAEPEFVGHTIAASGAPGGFLDVRSIPIMRRLRIGDELVLRLGITYIGDRQTDATLAVLKSEVVRRGIELTDAFNPVFGAALAYAKEISRSLLEARRNRKLVDFTLGLYGNRPANAVAPRLMETTYVLVQVPSDQPHSTVFTFNGMRYSRTDARVVQGGEPLDYNHMLLSIIKQ